MSEHERLIDELASIGVRVTWCRHIDRPKWLPGETLLLIPPTTGVRELRSVVRWLRTLRGVERDDVGGGNDIAWG